MTSVETTGATGVAEVAGAAVILAAGRGLGWPRSKAANPNAARTISTSGKINLPNSSQ
jgi:hypothetical protein